MKRLTLTATAFLLLFSPVQAENRFAVIERDAAIIRVDTQTGRVSFCREEGGKPVCKLAADERQAWMKEVEELEKRINQLQGERNGGSGNLSSKEEKDLDKALDTAETMMRRFFNMMKSLKKDLQ